MKTKTILQLPHRADRDLHGVRGSDAQNPRGVQRVQVHRLHHVHDVRHLAGVRTHLLQHSKQHRHPHHQHERDHFDECHGDGGVSLHAQTLHHPDPAGAQRAPEHDASALLGGQGAAPPEHQRPHRRHQLRDRRRQPARRDAAQPRHRFWDPE
jgi:hypothetical protein